MIVDLAASSQTRIEAFLRSRKAENTRRAYRSAFKSIGEFCGKRMEEISRADVAAWVDHLKAEGAAAETVNVRVAALSAYYRWAMEYELVEKNPAAPASLREKTSTFGKSKFLTADQVKALLGKIPTDSIEGLKDLALISTYALTGRRNSEIRLLKMGDVSDEEGVIWYRWSGKGKTLERSEMPGSAWGLIARYLRASGREKTISGEDYIFEGRPGCPMDASCLNRRLKKYAKAAGIAWWKEVHVHTLRHSSAMGRLRLGAGIEEISADLAHNSLAVTGVYVRKVAGHRDVRWVGLSELFGVPYTDAKKRRQRR